MRGEETNAGAPTTHSTIDSRLALERLMAMAANTTRPSALFCSVVLFCAGWHCLADVNVRLDARDAKASRRDAMQRRTRLPKLVELNGLTFSAPVASLSAVSSLVASSSLFAVDGLLIKMNTRMIKRGASGLGASSAYPWSSSMQSSPRRWTSNQTGSDG